MNQTLLSMILAGLLALVMCMPLRALTMTVPGTVTVHGTHIMLGEIATIEGTPDEAARVSSIALGSSPLAGKTQVFSASLIGLRLRQQGIAPETVTMNCPKVITVTRASVEISGATITETACAWLRQQESTPGVEMQVTPTRIPAALQAPEGEITWECRMAGSITGNIANVQVAVLVDGQPCWRGLVTMRVQRQARVLIAKKAIANGTPLNDSAVSLEWHDITGIKGKPLTEVKLLQGMQAAHAMTPGDVITDGMLEKMPAVLRNQPVHVRAVCGAIEIIAQAIACEDGVVGDTIRVRNPKTQETYTVRIVGDHAAELTL